MAKRLQIDDLNNLYSEAEQVDYELFAEQRSNVLLVAGDHFSKKGSKFWNRIREAKDITNETKLRLTKNHLHKICRAYVNAIISQAPGVGISPKVESERADQKAAELHHAVWQHIKTAHKIKKRTREFVCDFVDIGETFCKVFWDPSQGQFLGYEAATHPDTGEVLLDEKGVPAPSETPVFSGDLVFERVFAFNVLRPAEAKSMDEARFLCIRKMVDIDRLKAMVGDDQSKLKSIEEGSDETFTIFDANKGAYGQSDKAQCLVREFYFRKSAEFPKGYYFIATKNGILFEGDLGVGPNKEYLFPVAYAGFDELATTPRARSILKQLRPYQAEISRCSSKIAEIQITSDSKILIQQGTKISQGGTLPGIRAIQYSGMAPQVMQGQSGDQYLPYLQAQIQELYQVANVAEEMEEQSAQQDPTTMLFRSMKDKKKFVLYAEKIEALLVDIADIALRLYKAHAPMNMVIPAVGRNEFVNMAEFKRAGDLGYQITIEPMADDIETKLGKTLMINQIIQYTGNKLEREDIGKIARLYPFSNKEMAFSDFTIDFDSAENLMLALDRGEYPQANRYDNHSYLVKRLTARMRQADFNFLSPQIQMAYQQKIQEHEQMDMQLQQQAQAAKAGYIPTGGYLVGCDFYVTDPTDKYKTRRARVPYQSLDWLINTLEQQGMSLKKLEDMQLGVQADMGNALGVGSGLSQPGGMPMSAPGLATARQLPASSDAIAGVMPPPGPTSLMQ